MANDKVKRFFSNMTIPTSDKFTKFFNSAYIYIFVFIMFFVGLIINVVIFHQHKWEVPIYLLILLVTIIISIKALQFLYRKSKEVIENFKRTKFLCEERINEISSKNSGLRHNLLAAIVIFGLALSFPTYVIFLNEIYFVLSIRFLAFIYLFFTLLVALYAGYYFIIFVSLIRYTAKCPIKNYNKVFPIATPSLNDLRSGVSTGLIYFWLVGLLLLFTAFSHAYVLNQEGGESGRELRCIVETYSTIVSASFNNGSAGLTPVWIMLIFVFIVGFIAFTFYPYYLLRSAVLSLKVDSMYDLYTNDSIYTTNSGLLEKIKFINESPNWYTSSIFISAIPLILSLVLAFKELLVVN